MKMKTKRMLAFMMIGSVMIHSCISFSAGELDESFLHEEFLEEDEGAGDASLTDNSLLGGDELIEDSAFPEDPVLSEDFLLMEEADEDAPACASLPEASVPASELPDPDIILEEYWEIVQVFAGEYHAYYPEDAEFTSEELFDGYLEELAAAAAGEGETFKYGPAGIKLTGIAAILYEKLYEAFHQVAVGTRTSTTFEFTLEELGLDQSSWSAQDLGVEKLAADGELTEEASSALNRMIWGSWDAFDAIRLDYPFELFWQNVTDFYSMRGPGYHLVRNEEEEYRIELSGTFAISIPVDPWYAAGTYAVKPSVSEDIRVCVNNAMDIVQTYSSKSDLEKLYGYMNEICSLVSYNYDAANANAEGIIETGNPWQLIWVFDGDDSTDVVCEGYAKAFQYLCNLTDFDTDITCMTVTGTVGGGHKWNVVRMDDGNTYLADVTFCDGDPLEALDGFFLAGAASGDRTSGYTIVYQYDNGYSGFHAQYQYIYDDDTLKQYGEEINLVIGDPYHTHVTVTDERADPTCTETGLTEGSHCSGCGSVFAAREVIPAAGHTIVEDKEIPPTCTATGMKSGTHCSVCEETLSGRETIPALGHKFGEWTTAREATEEEEGLSVRICERCGEEETSVIEKLPHSHIVVTDPQIDPTCTETGLTEGTHCSKCNEILSGREIIPAIGHDYDLENPVWDWGEDFQSASVVFTCRNNPDHKEIISGTVTPGAVENASYTKTGKKTYSASAVYKNQEYTGEITETIPVLTPAGVTQEGIRWSIENGILTVGVQADSHSSQAGGSDSTVTVIRDYGPSDPAPWLDAAMELGAAKIFVSEGITKIGEHSFDGITAIEEIILPRSLTEIADNGFEKTALDTAKISYAGTLTEWSALTDGTALSKVEVTSTHVHTWNGGIIVQPPTTTAEGLKLLTCTDCGETKKEPVPRLVVEKKPTVTKIPTIKTPAAAKTSITVKWTHFKTNTAAAKKIWKGIKKVQIQCSTDKKFKKIVKTTAVSKSKTKGVLKGLKKNTTYYIRIRYTDGKGFSKWSGTRKVKTRK